MKRKFTILLTSLVVCISAALCISAYPQTEISQSRHYDRWMTFR